MPRGWYPDFSFLWCHHLALSQVVSLTMGRQDYRPWSDEEEEKLEGWVAQHLDLTWPERAEEYSKTICPRSSESLRSKLRQKRNISRRPALHMRHLRSRRDMTANAVGGRQQALVPSWSGSCPRYITSRQAYAGMHELPSAEKGPLRRNTSSVNKIAASRLPDKSKDVKRPGDHSKIDLSPQSTSKTTKNAHARGDADHQCCPRETHLVIPAHPETTPHHKPRVAYSLQPSWSSEASQLRSTQARQREQGIYFHRTT